MCRLLGWATRTPTSLRALLGDEDLDAFTELSCKHGDGWGLAHRSADGIEVHKRPDAARESDVFATWARTAESDLGMVHLRWATLGLPVRPENTHPFTDGRVAFAHNGSVRPPSSLDRLVAPAAGTQRHGDTDSERYFLAVLSRLADAEPEQALAATVGTIAAELEFTSLNCLLLTPDRLLAVCRFDEHAEAAESEPDYFRLRFRASGDAVVVASTGWGRGWQEVANGELLSVDRRTLEVRVTPIEDLRAAA